MENIETFKMDKFPLNLNLITDLIYFEGSLLSLFKNEFGDIYLYYWCDANDNYNRWIIFRLSKERLKSYIFKKLSLNSLILSPIDGFVYIADINDNLKYSNIYLVQPDKIPESYIPESDSFYDFESELDNDSKFLLLKHIFDDKEITDILLKLLDKYETTLKDLKNKLTDILFGLYQREIRTK